MQGFEEALEVSEEGIQADHTSPKVFFYINKAVALSSLNKLDEAVETYNKAIELYPKNYLLWFNRGEVLEDQNMSIQNDCFISFDRRFENRIIIRRKNAVRSYLLDHQHQTIHF